MLDETQKGIERLVRGDTAQERATLGLAVLTDANKRDGLEGPPGLVGVGYVVRPGNGDAVLQPIRPSHVSLSPAALPFPACLLHVPVTLMRRTV